VRLIEFPWLLAPRQALEWIWKMLLISHTRLLSYHYYIPVNGVGQTFPTLLEHVVKSWLGYQRSSGIWVTDDLKKRVKFFLCLFSKSYLKKRVFFLRIFSFSSPPQPESTHDLDSLPTPPESRFTNPTQAHLLHKIIKFGPVECLGESISNHISSPHPFH
jgi:hypothetical protein